MEDKKDLETLEQIMILMRKHHINAVKVGDIEVANLLPIPEPIQDTKNTESPEDKDDILGDDILFYST